VHIIEIANSSRSTVIQNLLTILINLLDLDSTNSTHTKQSSQNQRSRHTQGHLAPTQTSRTLVPPPLATSVGRMGGMDSLKKT
jgi:hypothetical protein